MAANGISSNDNGTQVKFMYFCRLLFTFNKCSVFLASLVICIHEIVGLCMVWITDLHRGLSHVCAHGAQKTASRTGKIRFWTGMVVDIVENSIFPGDQIVKLLYLAKVT